MPDQQISTIYEHQVRKPGKSAPGGLVLGPTRYDIGGKVRLVCVGLPIQTATAT